MNNHQRAVMYLGSMDWMEWHAINNPLMDWGTAQRICREVSKESETVISKIGDWTQWFDMNHLGKSKLVFPGVYMIAESYHPWVFPELTYRTHTPLPVYQVKIAGTATDLFRRLHSIKRGEDMNKVPTSDVIRLAVTALPMGKKYFKNLDIDQRRKLAESWTKTRNFWVRYLITKSPLVSLEIRDYLTEHFYDAGVPLWGRDYFIDYLSFEAKRLRGYL